MEGRPMCGRSHFKTFLAPAPQHSVHQLMQGAACRASEYPTNSVLAAWIDSPSSLDLLPARSQHAQGEQPDHDSEEPQAQSHLELISRGRAEHSKLLEGSGTRSPAQGTLNHHQAHQQQAPPPPHTSQLSEPLGGQASTSTQRELRTTSPSQQAPALAEVVFDHYLQLVQQDTARSSTMSGPPGWSPKGVAALFTALCPAVEPLDPASVLGGLASFTRTIAPPLASVEWLLVAPFLWAVRQLIVLSNAGFALLVALLGFCFMIIVDDIAWNQAISEDQRLAESAAATASATRPRPHALKHFVVASASASAAPKPSAAASPAVPAPATNHVGATAAARSTAPPAAGKTKEDPMLQQVRALLIKLEELVYGNEMTDGLLPADALPSRTLRLCEDFEVPFKAGGGPAEMMQALKAVQTELVGNEGLS